MTEVAPSPAPARVDLAREPPFSLGDALIRPATCEVELGDRRLKLQPRVMQVLVALARADGEVVSRDELVERCWGGIIVGDDAINRCIVRLRRLAEIEAPGAFSIETLARVGYRLTASPSEAPPAPGRPRRLPPRAWSWGIGACALVAALAVAGVWLIARGPDARQSAVGVAVMPFEVAPGDVSARSFADGVGEEIASSLSQADLKSLPSGADGSMSAPQRDAAALRLGAAFALSGRVQRDGADLDVNVAVDDARRHSIVWSASFRGPGAQAQSLVQDVVAKTAAVLHCTLDASSFQGGRMDDESLALYLRGCDWLYSDAFGAEGPALFRKVVEREPGFAPGWAKYALVTEAVGKGYPPDQAAVAMVQARAAAEKALQLDPRQGLAYAALADMTPPQHLWEQQALLQKGLSVAPDNADLDYVESDLLVRVGRQHDALAYAQRAASLDPLQFNYFLSLSTCLAIEGRVAEARGVIERAMAAWPGNGDVLQGQIAFEARWGDPDRAVMLLDDPKSRPAGMESAQADDWRQFALARKSHDPKVAAAYARGILTQVASGGMDPDRALIRLNSLGATDAAFTVAAQANPEALDTEGLFRSAPGGTPMWRDPRFLPLAARLGLVGFWRRSGLWPDFCEAPDRPYDCRAETARLHLD